MKWGICKSEEGVLTMWSGITLFVGELNRRSTLRGKLEIMGFYFERCCVRRKKIETFAKRVNLEWRENGWSFWKGGWGLGVTTLPCGNSIGWHENASVYVSYSSPSSKFHLSTIYVMVCAWQWTVNRWYIAFNFKLWFVWGGATRYMHQGKSGVILD